MQSILARSLAFGGLMAVAALASIASPPTAAFANDPSPGAVKTPVSAVDQPSIVTPGFPHPVHVTSGQFDIIVSLKFPAPPTPSPTAVPTVGTTPTPIPTFVPAPRYNVGYACSHLSVGLYKVTGYIGGSPGSNPPPAIETAPIGVVTPVTNSYVGLGCVASFTGVPANFPLMVATKYQGQTISFAPIGNWSNPFSLQPADPKNPVTGHDYRALSIALP